MACIANEIVGSLSVPQFVDVDGSKVRLLTRENAAASSRPVLFINGIGARLEMWQRFTESFQARQLLMFDLPGISGTSAQNLPLSMSGIATWITHLLDARDIDTVDVIGYSWGGALAQQLTHDAPRRVRALILASTTYGIGVMPSLPTLPLLNVIPTETGDDSWKLFGAAMGG